MAQDTAQDSGQRDIAQRPSIHTEPRSTQHLFKRSPLNSSLTHSLTRKARGQPQPNTQQASLSRNGAIRNGTQKLEQSNAFSGGGGGGGGDGGRKKQKALLITTEEAAAAYI